MVLHRVHFRGHAAVLNLPSIQQAMQIIYQNLYRLLLCFAMLVQTKLMQWRLLAFKPTHRKADSHRMCSLNPQHMQQKQYPNRLHKATCSGLPLICHTPDLRRQRRFFVTHHGAFHTLQHAPEDMISCFEATHHWPHTAFHHRVTNMSMVNL